MLTDYELAVLTMPATKAEINAHAAKLDMQLYRAIECIGQRLVHDGWGPVEVQYHEGLRAYTFIVTRYEQDRGTWKWWRTFGRLFLTHCVAEGVADMVAERVRRAWDERHDA